ncbi:RNA polymerase sigma factor [Luteimonas dalianensis]|uniref:RNA polymerase sigma factor n=1 Tax=Luteimonas dalianensis TaxID=1148196 RepID=UPI003BF0DF98
MSGGRLSAARARWLADEILPHEPALRSWLQGRAPASMEVDDVVQEAYAVLAGLDDVAHILEPRAYLFTVVRSVMLQQLRRARIVPMVAVAEVERLGILTDEVTPEESAVAGQDLRRTGELIASLPHKCREAFVLRRVEGLPQREIAARMGISENTVEKHIGKALRLLMEAMGRGAVHSRGGRGGAIQGQQDDDNDATSQRH